MSIETKVRKSTGVCVPLGSLKTGDSPVIGEYTSLVPFAEFCGGAGLSVMQLLPILDSGTQSSPYSILSAFALHPIYIDLRKIASFERCMSQDAEFRATYGELLSLSGSKRFDYGKILSLKETLLKKMYRSIKNAGPEAVTAWCDAFTEFFSANRDWLVPYCVFKTLKENYAQAGWKTWAEAERNMDGGEIERRWREQSVNGHFDLYSFEQFVAHRQLKAAAEKIREMGITLKCDLPILLDEDSCDVWADRGLFNMSLRAGSPPDGDNPTGQRWGFPVYDWEAQEKDGFRWWKRRLSRSEEYFGACRLDHIPGFFRFWAADDGEDTAEMGHPVPTTTISEASLSKAGFSKERIRWLREPHLSTEDVFRRTGSFDKAHAILSMFCERIGREELWLFKKSFGSTRDIRAVSLAGFELDEQIQREITEFFCRWWKNRTLVELRRGQFVPFCRYGETRAWGTLSGDEKKALDSLFQANARRQERLWARQAERIFSSIISSTKMVPCGEDLGVAISSMPKILDEFGILGLKVVRWSRRWAEEGQPFEEFDRYRPLSLVTTSVHDSSTIRQWWDSEKDSAKAFCLSLIERAKRGGARGSSLPNWGDFAIWGRRFDPAVAEFVLSNCARANGVWFVNPLQDWLYLDARFYSESAEDERINIPGTVSEFNWTWRMPCTVEELRENATLSAKIRAIAEIHDGTERGG